MVKKKFWQNVLPAMVSFAFSGIYAIVDGIFVGRNIGDLGLAAINIAYPLSALIQAVGMGIGMAGAIWIAICIGKGEAEKEKKYLETTSLLLVIFSILMTVFLSIFNVPILKLFGASNIILEHASDYMRVIALGSVFQILGVGLIPIIRNYNGALLAMWAMVSGFISNIILDWLFISVLSYGATGAAVATVIGEAITMIPCLIFLIMKNRRSFNAKIKIELKIVKDVLFTALSPFGLTLSPNIIVIVLNKASMVYGNELAVACYAIISYVICVVQLLLQGIGDGSQPLFGRYYGANDTVALKKVRKMAYIFAPLTAIFSMLVLYLLRNIMPILFGASEAAANMYAQVLPYFLSGFVFLAFLRVTTSYFYATQKHKYAHILICGEPIVLTFLVIFVLPPFLKLQGVWLSIPVTQFILSMVGLFFVLHSRKKCGSGERT
ncbi:MAG: MATE family efflux transporter [Clostridia bacterium]